MCFRFWNDFFSSSTISPEVVQLPLFLSVVLSCLVPSLYFFFEFWVAPTPLKNSLPLWLDVCTVLLCKVNLLMYILYWFWFGMFHPYVSSFSVYFWLLGVFKWGQFFFLDQAFAKKLDEEYRTFYRAWSTFPPTLEWVSATSSFSSLPPRMTAYFTCVCVCDKFGKRFKVYFISLNGDCYLSHLAIRATGFLPR